MILKKPEQQPSPERRRIMQAVKSNDTRPEMIVRRLVHGLGYRYRLHQKSLPGAPDLVFAGRRKVIFVNGCFWHGHTCARGARQPVANGDYWRSKIARNIERDAESVRQLEQAGWSVLTVWECQLKVSQRPALARWLVEFMQR